MRAGLRASDLAARLGGEEFGLIIVAAETEAAATIVERLRRVIEHCDFVAGGGGRLTISAGLATAPGDATDFEGLFRLADDTLYPAKAAGRNRVCLADSGDRRAAR